MSKIPLQSGEFSKKNKIRPKNKLFEYYNIIGFADIDSKYLLSKIYYNIST